MVTFWIAFDSVLPLFLVIATGILFTKSSFVTEAWIDTLNKYALKIGLPALVLSSLLKIDSDFSELTGLIMANSVYFVCCMLLAVPLAKIFGFSNQLKRALILVLSYGNVAYLGIPVLKSAYGEQAVPVAGIISAIYIFWLLTLGIALIEFNGDENHNNKKLLINLVKNPLLLSVLAGIIIVALQVKIPFVAEKTIRLFADSVTAVVLFSLGVFLGFHKAGTIKEWGQAFFWSLVIIIILPATFLIILKNSSLSELQLKASVLEAAMPLGLTPYALAIQYKIETTLISRIVVLSTLLSMITIPCWIILLG